MVSGSIPLGEQSRFILHCALCGTELFFCLAYGHIDDTVSKWKSISTENSVELKETLLLTAKFPRSYMIWSKNLD